MRNYSKNYNEKIRSNNKLYAVDLFYGVKNEVLVLDDLSFIEDYLNFYNEIKINKSNPTFNFPVLGLPINDLVYEIEKMEDKGLTKVATYSLNAGRLTFVWVYSDCLHDKPQ